MTSSDIGDKIKFKKVSDGEFVEIEQEYVTLREGSNKVMAFHYRAPIFETIEFERFFEKLSSSDKIIVNIGGTGGFGAHFRGLVQGKQKNYSQNLNHLILYLEEYKCPKKEEREQMGKSSHRFVNKHKK